MDALSLPWGGETNRLPSSWVPRWRTYEIAARPLICPEAPWAPWWSWLRCGAGWARDVRRVVLVGQPAAALDISRRDLGLIGGGGGPVIAVRFCRS